MIHKRLGTDLVTLSIKYSAIVVETMKSVIDPDIDVIIDSEYRQIRRRTLYFSADGRHARLILSCHIARRSNYYFVKNLTVALSVNLRIIFVAFQYFLNLIFIILLESYRPTLFSNI